MSKTYTEEGIEYQKSIEDTWKFQAVKLSEALERFVVEGKNMEPQCRYLWQEARATLASFNEFRKMRLNY